ncbi:hypothetical protein P5673_002054 [Acropora cervicornis]|uniref:Uncharacterized protein n=1 Tax=Acropora cervicornis TaxID=6130 RepID=A0AAD9R549_ACRCE|nr:hypothetical protein P5673_002054 [Acropora cervicornis]
MRISGSYKDINPICALQQLCSDTFVLQLFALAIFNNLMTLRMQSAPPSLMASFHTRHPIIKDHYTLGQCCGGAFECDKYLQSWLLTLCEGIPGMQVNVKLSSTFDCDFSSEKNSL